MIGLALLALALAAVPAARLLSPPPAAPPVHVITAAAPLREAPRGPAPDWLTVSDPLTDVDAFLRRVFGRSS